MKTKHITQSNDFIPNTTVGDPFWRPTAPENIALGGRGEGLTYKWENLLSCTKDILQKLADVM